MHRTMSVAWLVGSGLCFAGAVEAQPADASGNAAVAAPQQQAEPEADVTITGVREERARPTTGSRVPRNDEGIQFQSVATDTGVAGLTPGSGMDPFAGGTRYLKEVECRSDDDRVSASAACRLVPVQALVAAGSYEEARAAIDRFISSDTITDEERYIAARIWYQIGQLGGDPLDREDALLVMLGTAAMPAEERVAALRTLIAMALRRDDRTTAIRLLEQLLPIAPDDARSRVNLASLYSEGGRAAEATILVREAIAITRARGEAVPSQWTTFATANP